MYSVQQILLAIRIRINHGNLCARENDRLLQILYHQAHCAGRICHRVGAVGDNHAVIGFLCIVYFLGDGNPVFRLYIGSIQLHDVLTFQLAVFAQLRHHRNQLFSGIYRYQTCVRMLAGDVSARGQHQNLFHIPSLLYILQMTGSYAPVFSVSAFYDTTKSAYL